MEAISDMCEHNIPFSCCYHWYGAVWIYISDGVHRLTHLIFRSFAIVGCVHWMRGYSIVDTRAKCKRISASAHMDFDDACINSKLIFVIVAWWQWQWRMLAAYHKMTKDHSRKKNPGLDKNDFDWIPLLCSRTRFYENLPFTILKAICWLVFCKHGSKKSSKNV